MINVFSSFIGKEELAIVNKSFEKQWLGAGENVKIFEKKFINYKNLPNFLMVDNATNGLFLACKLLNIELGSEIILPSFTCIACAQAIKMAGFNPVFCDVDYETQNVTIEHILPHITHKTKAIMIVHYAGLPVDMEPILRLGYPIIEDVAHAVDSSYNGKSCGSYGDIGVFSFDPIKNIASCEGGGMTFINNEHYEKALNMRLCGTGSSGLQRMKENNTVWWEDHAENVFIKTYPNDISAGIAIAQLEKLNILQERRKKIWDYYQSVFLPYSQINLPIDTNNGNRHSYFTFCIRIPKRNELAFYLLEKKVYTTLRFFPLHLNKIYYNSNYKLSNSEKLSEFALNIPLHPNLSDQDVNRVAELIVKFYK
jgi:aminotransferase